MSDTPKILAFAGSTRSQSFNRRLLSTGIAACHEAGAEVTRLELADYPLPIMDEDLEAAEGLPEGAIRLKELFKAHDGFLIACPEYNSAITPLLKNVIDWVSRPREGEAPLEPFAGKACGLIAASAGALGGLRGLYTVRSILMNIRVVVVPEMAAVGNAHEVLDGETITDDRSRAMVEQVARRVVEVARALRAPA